MADDDPVRLSKRLSRILRHRGDIPHDEHGWFLIDDVERLGGMDRETVLQVAASNGRYEISEDGTGIRAYHGHSIDIEYENEVEPPEHLYHGTSAEAWTSIQECGRILPMRRCEVHLTASLDYAREIALRRGHCEENMVILVIDARRMRDDGRVFHLSGDGTYLVKDVPVGYTTYLGK